MTVTIATYAEIQAEISAQDNALVWAMNAFGRMCLESPELAAHLIGPSMASVTSGVVTYDAMQRQIRKDALAELATKAKPGGDEDEE